MDLKLIGDISHTPPFIKNHGLRDLPFFHKPHNCKNTEQEKLVLLTPRPPNIYPFVLPTKAALAPKNPPTVNAGLQVCLLSLAYA